RLAEPEGFEPSKQVLPAYSLSRGAPSASRSQLRRAPILRARLARDRCAVGGGRLLIEVERPVQRAHRELHVFLVDYDARLDLARRDHLDVDAFARERAEHAARDADVRSHPDADDRDLADAQVA